MARAAEPFSEAVHYIKVVYQEYCKRNDLDTCDAIEQEISDLVHMCSTTEAEVRQTIKDLSKQVHDLETVASYPHRDGLHADRVAALQRQIDVAKRAIEDMDVQARTAEQQCEEVDARLRCATAAAREAAAASSSIGANLKSQLAMYKHITSTTWWPGKPTISGTVSDTKTGDIRVFDFDQNISQFELINKLWDLL
ncbi:hypothetical protein VaNZ11_007635 [Volvox africanus]|uniref:Kinetochore protein Spc24 n=1 Tax=Volvox africanus TaxID=51714 RepID=A0ABQ5S3Q7_9CHLO|nr:hypothetical protein VaNZ11_007635 [Volvox africanus]